MKKVAILIAASELVLAVASSDTDGKPVILEAGEELTPELAKAHKLKKDDLDDLVTRGVLTEVSARLASASNAIDPAELAAANKRADAAEAKVAELTAKVEALEADLAAATAPAKNA
ncbi:hypothetical protein DXH95_03070 [Sphingorhabdus pulchriflava]|uniref:Uncharacterized protein n=1 Tax=Sphingorhabdus pulchriflava TaxID=2292257 RepID=A0A371BFP4_9SPHN|nr:hypothetical protein [Sphingorhabdus pulchriflava]RDV06422.1 hypothetical protein DXH95_03070 [Sphingorhabdus pulchriflava]